MNNSSHITINEDFFCVLGWLFEGSLFSMVHSQMTYNVWPADDHNHNPADMYIYEKSTPSSQYEDWFTTNSLSNIRYEIIDQNNRYNLKNSYVCIGNLIGELKSRERF